MMTRHRLLDHARELSGLLGQPAHVRIEALGELAPEHVHERQGAEREHGQQRVDPEHDRGDRGDDHQVADRQRDQRDQVLDLQQVGVRAAHQLARLHAVVEREVQPLDVREHPHPQVGLGAPPFAERHVPT
jgi:hypothetical protein